MNSRKDFLRIIASTLTAGISTRGEVSASTRVQPVNVAVQRGLHKGYVSAGLAGLSYEKSKLATGFFSTSNTGLIGCFKRLGTSVLRVGGNTADKTNWAAAGSGTTGGQIAPPDVRALVSFLDETGWQVIYGINLATNTVSAAAAEAAFVSSALGDRLLSFEIGNECDGYFRNGLRPATYDLSDFISEWSRFARVVNLSAPGVALSGPASGYRLADWTVPFAVEEAKSVKFLSQHFYQGNGKSPTASMSRLLAEDNTLKKVLVQLQSAVETNGIAAGFRLTEANSLYAGGAPGLSNAHGSALWAIDFLLINAQYGSRGTNLHGGGDGSYNPFYTPIADVQGQVAEVRPIYYGMLFVSHIAPGPMYGVKVTTELNVSGYAVAGKDGVTYVAIVNKDADNAASTSVDFGAPVSSVKSVLLSGPGLDARTGTNLGGARVGNDGAWAPSPSESLRLRGSSATNIMIPPASAVLLSVV